MAVGHGLSLTSPVTDGPQGEPTGYGASCFARPHVWRKVTESNPHARLLPGITVFGTDKLTTCDPPQWTIEGHAPTHR